MQPNLGSYDFRAASRRRSGGAGRGLAGTVGREADGKGGTRTPQHERDVARLGRLLNLLRGMGRTLGPVGPQSPRVASTLTWTTFEWAATPRKRTKVGTGHYERAYGVSSAIRDRPGRGGVNCGCARHPNPRSKRVAPDRFAGARYGRHQGGEPRRVPDQAGGQCGRDPGRDQISIVRVC